MDSPPPPRVHPSLWTSKQVASERGVEAWRCGESRFANRPYLSQRSQHIKRIEALVGTLLATRERGGVGRRRISATINFGDQ